MEVLKLKAYEIAPDVIDLNLYVDSKLSYLFGDDEILFSPDDSDDIWIFDINHTNDNDEQ